MEIKVYLMLTSDEAAPAQQTSCITCAMLPMEIPITAFLSDPQPQNICYLDPTLWGLCSSAQTAEAVTELPISSLAPPERGLQPEGPFHSQCSVFHVQFVHYQPRNYHTVLRSGTLLVYVLCSKALLKGLQFNIGAWCKISLA